VLGSIKNEIVANFIIFDKVKVNAPVFKKFLLKSYITIPSIR